MEVLVSFGRYHVFYVIVSNILQAYSIWTKTSKNYDIIINEVIYRIYVQGITITFILANPITQKLWKKLHIKKQSSN